MSNAFLHPEWSVAAAGVVTLALVLLALARLRHERRRVRLLGRRSRGIVGPRDLLLAMALGCIAVALLGPLVGSERVRLPANGLDLVVLLDVSRSMDAADTPPSRLARARRAAALILAELSPGDRAALVVFAGQAAALTPLSPDLAALRDLLGFVDTRLTSDPSSRLDAGLAVALDTFDPNSARPRRLLVLSDGEHADGVSPTTLAALRRSGVRAVTAAIGSERGARIPTGRGRWLLDGRGEPVVSRRNSAALDHVASRTGGSAWIADDFGSLPASRLAGAVAAGAVPAGDGFVEQEMPVARTRLPAALALALLSLELLHPGRKRRRARTPVARHPFRTSHSRGRFAATAGLVALALLASGADGDGPDLRELEARLRRSPDDVHLLLEVGVARALEGNMREAERAFLAASVRDADPELAALAYYDLGVALLSRGHYEGARDAFFDSLAMDPGFDAARFNLAWSLRALSLDLPPQGGPKESEESQDPESGEQQGEPGESPQETQQEPSQRPDPGRDERHRAPPLSPEEAQRWLDAARDDPSRALRSAIGDQGGSATAGGPRW